MVSSGSAIGSLRGGRVRFLVLAMVKERGHLRVRHCDADRSVPVVRVPEGVNHLRGTKGVYWRGRLVTAIDGTMMCCPDTEANLRVYRRGGGHHGGTGYPMIRVLALLACGTRTIIDATFGATSVGETTYTRDLLPALRRGMILLAGRRREFCVCVSPLVSSGPVLGVVLVC